MTAPARDLLAQGRAVLAAQPLSVLLGTELAALSRDGAELRIAVRDDLRQQYGFVHGGLVSYLADSALAFAGGAILGDAVLTAEMKINFVRPAEGEALVARGAVLSAGRSQAVVRCEIFSVGESGERLCAAAQGTIVAMRDGRNGA